MMIVNGFKEAWASIQTRKKIAFVMLFIYCFAVAFLLSRYISIFNLPILFNKWHPVQIATFVIPLLTVFSLSSSRAIRNFCLLLLSLYLTVLPLSYVVQEVSQLNIGQRSSLLFILTNFPALQTVVEPWMLVGLAIGFIAIWIGLFWMSVQIGSLGNKWIIAGAFSALFLFHWIEFEKLRIGHQSFIALISTLTLDIFGVQNRYLSRVVVYGFLIFMVILLGLYLRSDKRREKFYFVGLLLCLWLTQVGNAAYYLDQGDRVWHWDPIIALLGHQPAQVDPDQALRLDMQEKEYFSAYNPSSLKPSHNIIVFMADSFNPKHLSVFGYERDTIPFISSLKAKYSNSEFAIGRAMSPESICGVMCTLTSRQFQDVPPNDVLGLPAVLRMHGYDVRMVLVGDHRMFYFGTYGKFIEQQSTSVYDYTTSELPLNTDKIAIEGLSALPDYNGKPALIFVFFFSSHQVGENEKKFAKYGEFLPTGWLGRFGKKYSEEDLQQNANHYDNKLHQLGYYFKRSFEILEKKGYTQDSTFVILGDHGEETGENGRLGHGVMSEGALKIPYIMASNKILPSLNNSVPHQLDLAPTVMDILGLPVPKPWQGISLFKKNMKNNSFHDLGMLRHRLGKNCQAIYGMLPGFDEAKYIKCVANFKEDTHQFFDLKADPLEQSNSFDKLSRERKSLLDEALAGFFSK